MNSYNNKNHNNNINNNYNKTNSTNSGFDLIVISLVNIFKGYGQSFALLGFKLEFNFGRIKCHIVCAIRTP